MSLIKRNNALILLGIMWAVFLLNLFVPFDFRSLGIRPRDPMGLIGLFTSPFLHANLFHIISNSIPFLVMGMLLQLQGRRLFWQVTLGVMVIGGFCVWLFSQAGVVVGASGLIFGYWGFLIAYGIFTRSFKSLIIAVVVFFFYGALVFSFLDLRPHISWSGHFFGAISGVFVAWNISKRRRKR